MAATVLRECVEGKVTSIIDADTFMIQIDGESTERTVHQPAAVVTLMLSDNDRVIGIRVSVSTPSGNTLDVVRDVRRKN